MNVKNFLISSFAGIAFRIILASITIMILHIIIDKIFPKIKWKKILKTVMLIGMALLCFNIKMRFFPNKDIKNIYSKFGVSQYASIKEIQGKFKKLSQEIHPDRKPELKKEYLELSKYYDILSHPQSRFAYDKFGVIIDSTTRSQSYNIMRLTMNLFSVLLNTLLMIVISVIFYESVKTMLIKMLLLISLQTYLVFIKDFPDIFDLFFPGVMTFEIIIHIVHYFYIVLIISQILIKYVRSDSIHKTSYMSEIVEDFYNIVCKSEEEEKGENQFNKEKNFKKYDEQLEFLKKRQAELRKDIMRSQNLNEKENLDILNKNKEDDEIDEIREWKSQPTKIDQRKKGIPYNLEKKKNSSLKKSGKNLNIGGLAFLEGFRNAVLRPGEKNEAKLKSDFQKTRMNMFELLKHQKKMSELFLKRKQENQKKNTDLQKEKFTA